MLGFCALLQVAAVAEPGSALGGLKKLSLEELMDLEVTLVSKRPQKLSETASAIQVLTAEDVRRSGSTTLPQALRLASNLQTAQVSPGYWTIGARGFNNTTTTSNKLLVMIDGRSVYSPLFSGVFWDTQDVFLPDVEQIEVISGPGGATWGANAVNGIINIVTKAAHETQGGILYGGGGGEERGFAGARYGGRIGRRGHYRVYAKHLDVDSTARPNGADARNRWVLSQAGFRTDWGDGGAADRFTLQGDAYSGWVAQPTASRGLLKGGNVLARWTRAFTPDSQAQVQLYYDRARRDAPNTFADRLDTIDLDVHHQLLVRDRHHVVWGINYRRWDDNIRNIPTAAFLPATVTTNLGGVFLQDEFELLPNRLRLSLGAKFEYNDYSGFDYQPSARAAWLINHQHTLWGAASRAVRLPSRVDRDLFTPPTPPFVIAGGPDFSSEVLWAYELGWRGRVSSAASFSLTLFQHVYDDLRSAEPTSPFPIHIANGVEGETYGAELSFVHAVTDRWRWNIGYALLRRDLRPKPGGRDLNRALAEGSDPEEQIFVRTAFDLPGRVEVDLGFRHVGTVPTYAGGIQGTVPAYAELDARVGWRVRDDLELAIVGRNLLHDRHPEAGAPGNRNEIERSVHGKVVWHF